MLASLLYRRSYQHRSGYNSRILFASISFLPKRVILVRHGESLGNKDENAYESTADHHIPLTKKGKEQAQELGSRLRVLIEQEPLLIYCSPYKRTKQTLHYIMRAFPENFIHGCREEPRLAGRCNS